MEIKNIYKVSIFPIISFFLFSLISCESESIRLTKKDCLFMDQITSDEEIISFEYIGDYYYYSSNIYNSVKMKYLGDSNKDIFLRCYRDSNYRDYIGSNTYSYYIPCYLDDITQLNEGTYCIQIVKVLVGSINSTNFCSDEDTFKVLKTNDVPILTVTSFSSDQNGCVQPGDTVTLLSSFQNIGSAQFDDYINIALSNTEVFRDDILLKCQIEPKINVGSNGKIICTIPSEISDGSYSIYYSSDLNQNNKCPTIIINSFNSLDFLGKITKIKVFKDNNFKNIIPTLTNITFENSSQTPGLFNLTFSLTETTNLDPSTTLTYEYFLQKNIGIKLVSKSGSTITTKCDFSKSGYTQTIFYLKCTPNYFSREAKYSLVIIEDIIIGYDKSQVLCTYEDSYVYSRIIIPKAEYDFFIIYDYNNLPYLDCNRDNNGFYLENIISPDNVCGSCGSNCLMCKNQNVCFKCLNGFTLKKFKDCELDRDKIDFDKFKEIERFIPNEELCGYNDNPRQLFTFKFSYVITNGENLAIESNSYNGTVFAIKENERYGLNCIIDVNPNYIPNGDYYGTCKQTICTLNAYVNCSFNEKASDGVYDIEINSYNEFGNLIRKAKEEFSPIQIAYIDTQITASISDNSIQVVYKGYASSSENIYLCPNISSKVSECYEVEDCVKSSYNENNEETIFKCSGRVNYNESCLNFERIMVEDYCWKYTNESFVYQYCPSSESSNNSAFSNFINLFIILIILLFII